MQVKVTIRTNKVGSQSETIMEFDDKDWNAMTDAEREAVCQDAAFSMVEWNYKEMPAAGA